jgi:hypothetical protein
VHKAAAAAAAKDQSRSYEKLAGDRKTRT